MNRELRVLLFTFFLMLIGVPDGAVAQGRLNLDERIGTAGSWTVGFNSSLEGCAASVTYSDETTIWLGVDGKDGAIYFALTNPNWKSIEAGKQYELQFAALGGGRWRGKFFGTVRENEKGVVSSGFKDNFIRDLVLSPGIAVSLGGQVIARLSLKDSPMAMSAIRECQSTRVSTGRTPGTEKPKSATRVTGNGTGFFVSSAGHVLTNHHVISGCAGLTVVQPGGLSQNARVIASDKNNDLAVLATNLKPPAVASLRSEIRLGEDIAVFGFPLSDTLASTGNFTVGNVTALAGMEDNSAQIQISAPIQPGNSGGPVFDRHGNVVAVIQATATSAIISRSGEIPRLMPQNVNFAIKSGIAVAFLNANGVKPDAPIDMSAVWTGADLADRAKTNTVKVLCLK